MTATTELIERALTLVRERPGMAESVSQVILELVDAVPVSATAVQQPNRDAVFEAIADRLGEHPKAHNEFDPSDEPVTCITLKGVPVEVLAEFIAPAVAALPVPATGEVEWATELRVDGVTEHRFPANSEADARATAAERGEVVVSRTATGWEVTP